MTDAARYRERALQWCGKFWPGARLIDADLLAALCAEVARERDERAELIARRCGGLRREWENCANEIIAGIRARES